MAGFSDLIQSISYDTNVDISDIYEIVVLNNFETRSLEDCKEKITSIITSIGRGIDYYTGKIIQIAGANADYNKDAVIKVFNENIQLLKEFMDQAIYAEQEINSAIISKNQNKQTSKKTLETPVDNSEPNR